ncbi:MAG: hypothetical protein WAZ60_23985 [Desulfosalsimonadaceae bacterium]
MRANGAVEGGAAGFSVGDEVIVLRKFNTGKLYVVAHVDGIKSCGDEYALITLSAWQGRFMPGDTLEPTYFYRNRIILWDIAGNKMATVPGVTFPCDPLDPTWVAWRTEKETVSEALFSASDRGAAAYVGEGVYPDETMPELDLPEGNVVSGSSTGYWYDYGDPDDIQWLITSVTENSEISCKKPLRANYVAPAYGKLLQSLITNTPVEFAAFRTSSVRNKVRTGAAINYGLTTSWAITDLLTVRSPFGILATYSDTWNKTDSTPGVYHGPWPMIYAPQHVDSDRGFYEKPYISQSYHGTKSDRSIVSIFLHQYRNVTLTTLPDGWADNNYECVELTFNGQSATSLENRVVNIHAQAKYFSGGVDGNVEEATQGKDFVAEGRSEELETALLAAIDILYAGFDIDNDPQALWPIYVTTEIITK